MVEHISSLFLKQLEQIDAEIKQFEHESAVWQSVRGVTNCAGNLILHIHGNLHHFIGAQLGHTGYVRERELEFSEKNFSRESLLRRNAAVTEMVKKTLDNLSESDLRKLYPLENFGKDKSTQEVLVILYGHLNYHLGQINYYRRLSPTVQ